MTASEENKEDDEGGGSSSAKPDEEAKDEETGKAALEESKEEAEIAVEADQDEDDSSREFPSVFYDPTSGEIMKDPVVNPQGDSIDKSSISDNTTIYYPNRALKNIIQREVDLASGSVRGTLRRIDESLRSNWGKLVEKSAFATAETHRPLPDSFYCPITCELIQDPVISKDGNSYEREAIIQWVQANGVSPITRNSLTVTELRDNNALYELIQEEKDRTADSIHPSIRRWKESGAPTTRPPLDERLSSTAGEPTSQAAAAANQATTPGTTATSNYPTTEAELRARRRQRSNPHLTMAVACFSILVALLFIPFGTVAIVVVVLSAILLCCAAAESNNQNRNNNNN